MWVLIMTIYITGSNQQGLTMSTVQGFTSEDTCRYAGASQEVALRQDLKINTKNYTFICVPKGK